jgi:acyl-CoA synthetase (NDP forming)
VTRLTPLTDADEMIYAARAAPLLSGDRGVPPVDTAALANAPLRVSRLADDLPEISELATDISNGDPAETPTSVPDVLVNLQTGVLA